LRQRLGVFSRGFATGGPGRYNIGERGIEWDLRPWLRERGHRIRQLRGDAPDTTAFRPCER
jgi:hypothetical protein